MLARRVRADGRTRALVNGRTAAVADLRAIGGALLRFHAQHEHRSLTLAGAQLAILDSRCGEEQAARLRACADAHGRLRELEAAAGAAQSTRLERDRELDLLDFEIAEIDSLAPDPQEHERMLALRERLRSLDSLLAAAGAAAGRLLGEDAAAAAPATAATGARAAPSWWPRRAAPWRRWRAWTRSSTPSASGCARSRWRRGSSAYELAGYCERAGEGAGGQWRRRAPATLEELEERLAAVERLGAQARREHRVRARVRVHGPGSARGAGRRPRLGRRARAAAAGRRRGAGAARRALRGARRAAAGPFSKEVAEQLATLAMPARGFEVVLARRRGGSERGRHGRVPDRAEPGGARRAGREIASGGELSRVMLAILSAAQGHEAGLTLVFDEVDAGSAGTPPGPWGPGSATSPGSARWSA